MMLEAVVFDLFGTLISSNPWRKYRPVVHEMAALLDLPADEFYMIFNKETRLAREVGRFSSLEENLEHVCRRFGVEPEQIAIREAAELRRSFISGVLHPRPDTLPTLQKLTNMGLKLGLISDASPEVPEIFARTEMASYFRVTVFSAQVGKKKPDPEMYRRACDGLSVSPEHVLYVGDGGSHELGGATAIGMSAVLILPEGETFGQDEFRPEASSWEGDRIVRLAQLIDLIQERYSG